MNNLSLANAAAPPRPKLLDCDTDSDEDGEGSGGVWVEQPSSTAYGTRVGGSAMMSKQAGTNPQSRLPGESQVDTASAASGQISTVETTSGAPAKMHDAWKSYNVTPRPGNAGTAASTNSARKFASSRSMVYLNFTCPPCITSDDILTHIYLRVLDLARTINLAWQQNLNRRKFTSTATPTTQIPTLTSRSTSNHIELLIRRLQTISFSISLTIISVFDLTISL